MALMDVIRKMSQNKAATKQKFRQLQEDDKLQHILQERKKSSNRRELEKHFQQEEEREIKKQLDKIRKKQQSDFFTGGKSILAEKTTMLNENKKLFKGGSSILAQKSIFLDNKLNNPITQEHMFF